MSEVRPRPRDEWHWAGIHVACKAATRKNRTVGGRGTNADACMMVKQHGPCIERFHHHDFDGPLPCDCPEWAD